MRTFLEQLQTRLLRLHDQSYDPNIQGELAKIMDTITAKLAEPLDAEDENETLKSDLASTLDAGDSIIRDIELARDELSRTLDAFVRGEAAYSDVRVMDSCLTDINKACNAWDEHKQALLGEPTEPATTPQVSQ